MAITSRLHVPRFGSGQAGDLASVEYQVNVSLLNGSSTPGTRTAFRDRLVRLGCEGVIVRHNPLNGILTARFLLRGTAQPQVAGRAERLVRKALDEAHIQAQLLMLGAARLATA